jgi:MoaA/NifB/PqqE/SkfB family radical SAM enzyme
MLDLIINLILTLICLFGFIFIVNTITMLKANGNKISKLLYLFLIYNYFMFNIWLYYLLSLYLQ